MFVPFHDDGIISQFEGYEDLKELDWDAYRAKYGNIQRLDRILRAEGDDPNRYKVSKQADTVMLFFLFSREELREIFQRLGYDYRDDTAKRNVEYYDRRTSHGSTLSFVTHAGVLAALDPDSSWERFMVALQSDAEDIQGGTTKEGIHTGVMSGTLDLVQRYFAGTQVRDGVLHFDPRLPSQLRRPVLPHAVPAPPHSRLAHPRPPDVDHAPRGRQPTVPAERSRRGPRDASWRPHRIRTGATAPANHPDRDAAMPKFQGAIFDVDGVLVDSPHEKAWRESLRELMESDWQDIREQTTWSPDAFTPRVYEQYVSGKPRMSGARAALDYFDVPDAEKRVAEYAQRKQEMVAAAHRRGRFHCLSRCAAFRHHDQGGRTADCRRLIVEERDIVPEQDPAGHLRAAEQDFRTDRETGHFPAGLLRRRLCRVATSPTESLTQRSSSPPHTNSASSLRTAIVMEDAAAGVEAAKRGGMNAIGIARADDAVLLAAADLVVTTLDEVDTAALAQGRLARKS